MQHETRLIFLVCVSILLTIITSFVVLVSRFRKRLLNVKCWFCNKLCLVSSAEVNSFECYYCKQYNGFKSDGSYNKLISAQFDLTLNKSASNYRDPSTFETMSDVLCHDCSKNQSIIIQKRSEFEPQREGSYDKEFKEFMDHLESVYGLCATCRRNSKERIKTIDSQLFPSFIEWWRKNQRRNAKSVRGSVDKTNVTSLTSFLLHLVLRLSSIICFLSVNANPFLEAVSTHTCHVYSERNFSHIEKLVLIFLCRPLQNVIRPYCLNLSFYSDKLALPFTGSLMFTSLFFVLQLVQVLMSCLRSSYSERTRKRRNIPIVFLCDVLFFSLGATWLMNFLKSTNSIFMLDNLSLNWIIYVTCFILTVLVILFVLYGSHLWIRFCSKDWKSQKHNLKESWTNSIQSFQPEHRNAVCFCSKDDHSLDDEANIRYSEAINHGLSEKMATTKISQNSTGFMFRPTLLTNLPDAGNSLGSQYSESYSQYSNSGSHAYENKVSGSPTHNYFPQLNDDCLTERSFRSRTSYLDSNSGYGTIYAKTKHTSSKRNSRSSKRKKRRTGLLRLILFFLFGQLESWSDLYFELTCLANAALLVIVLCAATRLLFNLVDVFTF